MTMFWRYALTIVGLIISFGALYFHVWVHYVTSGLFEPMNINWFSGVSLGFFWLPFVIGMAIVAAAWCVKRR